MGYIVLGKFSNSGALVRLAARWDTAAPERGGGILHTSWGICGALCAVMGRT
jgi:hypothetical protein